MKKHSIDYARRLLRELPGEAGRLLELQTYANPSFLDLFFLWLDDKVYRDPQAALPWAKVAPALALATPEAEGEASSEDRLSRVVEAWARLGSAYRSVRDHDAADAAYGEALALCETEQISYLVQADTRYRLATLRACQGRPDEALELAVGAVDELRGLGDAVPRVVMGQALVILGYITASGFARYGEAISAFGEALAMAGAGKTPAEQRLHESAVNSLAMAISDSGRPGHHQSALSHVRAAYRTVKRIKGRTPARYRLLWVEAIVWDRLGSHAKAERLYRRALEGFEALAMPWEAALVGLDLAAVLHVGGDLEALEVIAATTHQRFRVLSGANTQTLAALGLWLGAVRARIWTEPDKADPGAPVRRYGELHSKAREVVAAGAMRGECCRRRQAIRR